MDVIQKINVKFSSTLLTFILRGHSHTMWTSKGELRRGPKKSTLLYNPYRVKWFTKGEGVKIIQKNVHVVCERPPS